MGEYFEYTKGFGVPFKLKTFCILEVNATLCDLE